MVTLYKKFDILSYENTHTGTGTGTHTHKNTNTNTNRDIVHRCKEYRLKSYQALKP